MSDALTSSPPPPPGSEANFGYLFRLAHQRFRAALEDALHDLDLSAQEYGILSVFQAGRELSASELARIAQVTRQTMHIAVLRLEAAGLLERRASNQRTVLLRLTQRGRTRLNRATERARGVEGAALAGLTHPHERAVRAWLARVAAMPTGRS